MHQSVSLKLSFLFVLFLSLYVFVPTSGRAQQIMGVVVDEQTGERLSDVDVQQSNVFRSAIGESSYTTYTKTDSAGVFKISNRFAGRAQFLLNCIGYRPLRRSFVLSGNESDTLRLDTLRMKPSDILLGTAVVKGHAKRFFMRGDTVIFNPQAFQLEEGARLEELIKKLDGVKVDEKGALTWLGKPLRILVNGEDFMNGGQGLTSVLPAVVVDKIKAYNKASEFTERTGKDDGAEDRVLDLQIKPGWFEKWYGQAEASYETPRKLEGLIDAMRLSSHLPTLIFADVNNRDNLRTKTMGGSMWMPLGNGGKAQSLSVSMEHRADTTMVDSLMGNQSLRRRVGGSASFAHFDEVSDEYFTLESFMPGQLHTYTLSEGSSYNHNLQPSISFHSRYGFSPKAHLRLSGNFKYKYADDNYENRGSIYDAQPYDYSSNPRSEPFWSQVNDSLMSHLITRRRTQTNSRKHEGRGELRAGFEYYFSDKSNLSVYSAFNYSKSKSKERHSRHIDYFRQATRDYSLQQAHNNDEATKFSTNVGYRKSLSDNFNYNVSYDLFYGVSTQDNDYSLSGDEGQTWTDDAVNSFRDHTSTLKNAFRANLMWKVGAWQFNPEVGVEFVSERESYRRGQLDTVATRSRWLPSPSLDVKLRVNKVSTLEWSLSHRVRQPELLNTLNYIDTTDPMSVKLGNPNLRNAKQWDAEMRYSATFPKSQFLISASVGFNAQVNPVVSVWAFDPQTGANTIWYANARSGHAWQADLNLDKSLGEHFHVENSFNAKRQVGYGFLATPATIQNPIEARSLQLQFSENPRFVYETDQLSAEIYANLTYLRAENRQAGQKNNFWDYKCGTKLRLTLGKWIFRTEIYDLGKRGYNAADNNGDRWIWGASASWKCLKGKGKLSIEFNDILNNEKFYYSSVSAYERREFGQDDPHHYCSLTFTWNFDAVGGTRTPW